LLVPHPTKRKLTFESFEIADSSIRADTARDAYEGWESE